MKNIWGMEKSVWIPSEQDIKLAVEYVSARHEAYANVDAVAHALYDDIARGNSGGSYYMDGRIVPSCDDKLYSVGGQSDGVKLKRTETFSEEDVHVAIELLRDAIVGLQADNDDPLCIGYWFEGDDCCFDVSNMVTGQTNAVDLARERGEFAIYHFSDSTVIPTASFDPKPGAYDKTGAGWAKFKANTYKARMERGE